MSTTGRLVRLLCRCPTRYQLRRVVTLAVTMVLFTLTSLQVAAAADGGSTPGILGPFDVTSSENVPLDHYELVSNPGSVTDFQQEAQSYLMGALFSLVRMVVGLECWLIHWAYSFPLVQAVSQQSQQLADAYRLYVVDALGLPGLFLAWAVVVCSIMLMRGKVGKALGELALTFLIVAVAASALVRPDVILGAGGLLDQTRQASLEVASITTHHGAPPPASVDPASVSAPIQQSLTETFVAEPYQLLQFGRLIPQGDKAYPAYQAAISIGPFNTNAHADGSAPCVKMTGPGADGFCKTGDAPTPPNCSGLTAFGKTVCEESGPTSASNFRSYTDLANGFKTVDPAVSAYIAPPSWDRVFGALLVLIAALVVGMMVLAMVMAMFAAQFADAVLASCGYGALVWATLPGPSRAVLWRWVGSFVSSALVMFTAAVFLPLFGVAVNAFLGGAGPGLIPRLFLVDLLAVAGLGFHRRLLAGAGSVGTRVANRLRWARIGGSGSGDDATRTGQVLAGALAQAGIGGGLSAGAGMGLLGGSAAGSPAHAHLLRRARMLSSARALGDIPGTPLHPGRLLGDATRQTRHALSPATTAVRAGHHLWKGKALSPEALERRTIKPGTGGHLPVGSRLHNRLIQTRGGRTLLGTSHLAWNTTLGAPATWTRARRHGVTLMDNAERQARHYQLEYQNYRDTEWLPGARAMTTPAREIAKTSQRLSTAASLYSPHHADTVRRAATAAAAPPAPTPTAPTPRATTSGPMRPPHRTASTSAAPDPARESFVEYLHRVQREARDRDGGA
ncbi:hypothetical protein [Streptacidiphilus sp. EB129]|uniref:hypothetical protein n=1 Tax=Streptacidiphilus sp. EB129 TaxID=3156262 RepID=UPI0035189EDE